MQREAIINRIKNNPSFDIIVIGGGASGLGTAFDAICRGFRVLLVERRDFAKCTSSKSTKLIHGGVRYLAQGNVSLVHKSLKERFHLYQNAPHLVRDIPFILPCYKSLDIPFYYAGLKIYDVLAGFKKEYNSKIISKEETIKRLPYIVQENLKGSLLYHDGAFDDSRLALALAQGILEKGSIAINYMEAKDFIKENNKITGVIIKDNETNEEIEVKSNCVINACGIFVDETRKKDTPDVENLVKPAQGVHLILKNQHNLDIKEAMIIPKTKDGRVLFIVPWYKHFILGTTDTPMTEIYEDAKALQSEVDFIIETANEYFNTKISYNDITSVYAGQRPLVDNHHSANTKSLSRDEKIIISQSNLVSIAGGKWTTYRAMAEHTLNFAMENNLIESRPCSSEYAKIYGWSDDEDILKLPQHLKIYGNHFPLLKSLDGFNEKIHPKLDYTKAHVLYAILYEHARTVEDILARRLRALFIDAEATLEIAPVVAKMLKESLKKDENWERDQLESFKKLVNDYLISGYSN